jgi:outer membrane immunogenic protein
MGAKMKKLLIASTALVAFFAASAAFAADMAVRPPTPAYAPVSDWTGFYLGGHAGYGWGHDPFNELLLGNFGGASGNTSINIPGALLTDINPKGFVGGFHFGYNQQWGNWVGGVEVDISGTDMKGTSAGAATGSITNTTTTISPVFPFNTITVTTVTPVVNTANQEDKFDLLGSARARLGVLAWPNTLIYGTGGLAWTRFASTVNETITIGNLGAGAATSTLINVTASGPSWQFGWVAGVGGETKIYNSNWLFRVEYLHYDFGTQGSFNGTAVVTGGPNNGFSTTGFRNSGSLTADVVRGGISYKFGGNPI